jgi:hypothetical protein
VPNKPMVPTAPAQPDECLFRPLQRHIGQPLGTQEEWRAAPFEEQNVGQRPRATTMK